MKLNKEFFDRKFTIGCTGDRNNVGCNNGNYEEYCRLTITRIGSNSYHVQEYLYDTGCGDMYPYPDEDDGYVVSRKKAIEIIKLWEEKEDRYYDDEY